MLIKSSILACLIVWGSGQGGIVDLANESARDGVRGHDRNGSSETNINMVESMMKKLWSVKKTERTLVKH